MSGDLKGYYLGPSNYRAISTEYEHLKEYIKTKNSTIYGAVMVELKNKCFGFSIKFEIDTQWIKYHLTTKYCRLSTSLTWLCFKIEINKVISQVFKKIIKSHLRPNYYETLT